jgi:hypothetical protein
MNAVPNDLQMMSPMISSAQTMEFYHYVQDSYYHVTCKKISLGHDDYDDEHGFFYKTYYITYRLLLPYMIVNLLNKFIFGMVHLDTSLKHKEPVSLNQRFYLEEDLRHMLRNHILKKEMRQDSFENMNTFHTRCDNIMPMQTVLIPSDDRQNNFDNYLPHQNSRIGNYDNSVTHPQQVDINNTPQYVPDASSFYGDIASTTDSNQTNFNNDDYFRQNRVDNYNVFPQNGIDTNYNVSPQNGVDNYNVSPQQSFNNFSETKIDNNGNSNSFINDNIMTTQANQYYNNGLLRNDHQDLNGNGIRDYTRIVYSPQQQNNLGDFPQHHISESPDYSRNTYSLNDNDKYVNLNQNCDDNDSQLSPRL